MIKISQKGDWSRTNKFLERALNIIKLGELDRYGRAGVRALKKATPKDTGETADSWYYKIVRNNNGVAIQWLNSSQNEGIPIAILIQYGHGLQNGVFLEGTDFINPAMKTIFKEAQENLWKELTKE